MQFSRLSLWIVETHGQALFTGHSLQDLFIPLNSVIDTHPIEDAGSRATDMNREVLSQHTIPYL